MTTDKERDALRTEGPLYENAKAVSVSSRQYLSLAPIARGQEKLDEYSVSGVTISACRNVSAYHRGMMGGSTPNIDRIANEGMIFMDHLAHASCTAGRASS